MKSFSRIGALVILILKTMVSSALQRLERIKPNKKESDTDVDDRIAGDRIDNKDINLSSNSNTKMISSGAGFFTSEAKLAFI